MMTRKHYEKAVKHIVEYADGKYELNLLTSAFADFFEQDNIKFDRVRFSHAINMAYIQAWAE